jgi:hypothetical protein
MKFNLFAEVTQKGYKRSLADRFGDAMRHAGVGVTITSTTDVIVFLVGGTTVSGPRTKTVANPCYRN